MDTKKDSYSTNGIIINNFWSTFFISIMILFITQAIFHYYYHRNLIYYATHKGKRKEIIKPSNDTQIKLKIIHLNVWSGSKYTGELSPSTYFSFQSFETTSNHEERYQRLLRELHKYDPDIICLNEIMPCPSFACRLCKDLKYYDCVAKCGLLGLAFGFLRFPNISEGDAIFAKSTLNMKYVGRSLLSGNVYNDTFSCNVEDSTQCIGISIEIPIKVGIGEGENIVTSTQRIGIYNTHWRALPIDTINERNYIQKQNANGDFDKDIINNILKNASKKRLIEGKKCNDFIRKTSKKESIINVILTGDLNIFNETKDLNIIQRQGSWKVADDKLSNEPTWDPSNNKYILVQGGKDVVKRGSNLENEMMNHIQNQTMKLDHIWYCNMNHDSTKTNRIVPLSSKIIMNVDDEIVSDHYGLLVEFEVV